MRELQESIVWTDKTDCKSLEVLVMSRKLKCEHCGNVWLYKGVHKFYATCPNCRFKVSLKKKSGTGAV